MRIILLLCEIFSLTVASVAFVMAFNELHGARLSLEAGSDPSEAFRLIDQAHSMLTVATILGGIFLVLFIIRLVRYSAEALERKRAITV